MVTEARGDPPAAGRQSATVGVATGAAGDRERQDRVASERWINEGGGVSVEPAQALRSAGER